MSTNLELRLSIFTCILVTIHIALVFYGTCLLGFGNCFGYTTETNIFIIWMPVALIYYIFWGKLTPPVVSQVINTTSGTILISLFILYMMYYTNLYLILLSLVAVSLLLYRNHSPIIRAINDLTSSPRDYDDPNKPTDTLEQDMVRIRIPNSDFYQYPETDFLGTSFKPVEDPSVLPMDAI